MSTGELWDEGWLNSSASHRSMIGAWRGILTEHFSASLKLVDDADEMAVLEELLAERSPATDHGKHPQIYAPFSYTPVHPSRFRPAHQKAYWYGASTIEASLSEVAYWRMQFLRDSSAAGKIESVTEHSFFQIDVHGQGINLMEPPWTALRDLWRHGHDYGHTQALAKVAEDSGIQWIQYESVRAPHSPLAVVFTPDALHGATAKVNSTLREWTCKTNLDRVVWIAKDTNESMVWTIDGEL